MILDWTGQAPNPPSLYRDGRPRFQTRKGKVLDRDPKTITGITLHQTACVFGPKADLEKRNARAWGMPVHGVVFQDGVAIQPYPLTWYLYAANGWNADTCSVELEGRFPGLLDDPTTVPREDVRTTWGGKPNTLCEAQRAAACEIITKMVEDLRALGAPLRFVRAHRQSNGDRRSDPGQEIWQKIGLDHCVKVLSLRVENDRKLGTGRPLPRAWGGSADY